MSGDADEVILEIENTPITCKKQELIRNSDYFRAMLEGNFVEKSKKNIKLEGVDVKAMNIILILLWDESYFIDKEHLLSVLQASCMLQFINIKELCINQIIETLMPENCLKVWITTEQLDLNHLYLKAKSMALIEFEQIKQSDVILELTLKEVCTYLGNVNLQCSSELSVFTVIMKWWYENSQAYENHTETLIKLLKCLDFKALSVSDINEMKTYPDISNNTQILSIFDCVNSLKNKEHINDFNEVVVAQAKHFLNARSRIFQECPCIVAHPLESESKSKKAKISVIEGEIDASAGVYYKDTYKRKRILTVLEPVPGNESLAALIFNPKLEDFSKLLSIDKEKCSKLDGYKLLGYKEFIFMFGGEFLIGKGNWNSNFWVYDSVRERWERKSVLPYPRRHFESCISGNYLYIIGGTGSFRVIQENMFWYNYKDDAWSRQIMLPCPGRQLKCCSFNDKLLVLNINNKCGYFYEQDTALWCKIDICDSENVIPMFSQAFSVFSYRNSLFIKGDTLIELEIRDRKLEIVQKCNVKGPSKPYEDMESVICNNIVYTVYRHRCEETQSQVISFERLDLNTFEVRTFFPEVQEDSIIEIDNDMHYVLKPLVRLFKFHHYSFVEDNKLVSDVF